MHEAKSPTPDFAFVVCEDIERSARSMYNSLKLERELQDQGIPLFATDEPFNIEGINATTVLVRRVKQGVAEWYRLQLKGKVWDGLKEHSLAGWNLGSPRSATSGKNNRASRKVFSADHEGFLRPRIARSRAVSCLILRMTGAILVWPAWRISPIARLRSVAIMRGRGPVRTREESSRNVTSRTQWTLFSIVHWPRT